MAVFSSKVEVLIEVESGDRRLLEAIRKAIVPDNINVPSEMRINCETVGNTLKVSIELHEGNLLRLRNTVDELLEQISIAVRAIKDSREGQKQ